VVRLGDGTDESHRRMQDGIDAMWRFTGELFEADDLDRQLTADGIGIDPSILRPAWEATVDAVLSEATLMRPDDPYQAAGGRTGVHTEHLGHLLAEMQWMQRTYPGLKW
jgi:ring-1,2-phenylacetyl-CoA epoxidase subunit PaaC